MKLITYKAQGALRTLMVEELRDSYVRSHNVASPEEVKERVLVFGVGNERIEIPAQDMVSAINLDAESYWVQR